MEENFCNTFEQEGKLLGRDIRERVTLNIMMETDGKNIRLYGAYRLKRVAQEDYIALQM